MNWDNQFLSKREIYNSLREIAGSYGSCMAVDKESAVHRCMDALMPLPPSNVNMVVHCRECKHWADWGACAHPKNGFDAPPMGPDDFCSFGKKK